LARAWLRYQGNKPGAKRGLMPGAALLAAAAAAAMTAAGLPAMLAMAASEAAILSREKAGLPGCRPALRSTDAGWGDESIELWLLSEG